MPNDKKGFYDIYIFELLVMFGFGKFEGKWE